MSKRNAENNLSLIFAFFLVAVSGIWWYDHHRLQQNVEELGEELTRAHELIDRQEVLMEDITDQHIQVITVADPNKITGYSDDLNNSTTN